MKKKQNNSSANQGQNSNTQGSSQTSQPSVQRPQVNTNVTMEYRGNTQIITKK